MRLLLQGHMDFQVGNETELGSVQHRNVDSDYLSSDQYSDSLNRQVANSVSFQSVERFVLSIIDNTASSVPIRQVTNIKRLQFQSYSVYI